MALPVSDLLVLLVPFGAMVGLLFGSFFNVVIWRVPRGESVISPGSHCPNCESPVRPYDNIPVLSWLLLRGRCRHCAQAISFRYPAVELLTAALTTLVALTSHSLPALLLGEILVLALVPAALIDLDHHVIPNVVLAPAAVLALAVGALTHPGGLGEQLIAGVGAGGFLLLFALAYPRGMGMGDVKLAAVMGLFLGRSVTLALFAALLLALCAGMAVILERGVEAGRRTAIPFGPFLAAGAVIALLWGAPVVHWYLTSVI